MDFLTNKKTGEAFPVGSSGVSSSEFHNKDSDVISTELEQIHMKESDNEMGIGARVKLIKKFGINDVPVGTEGTIIDQHFGRDRPTVLFRGGMRKVMEPENLEVLKGSSKNQPMRYSEIKVYGSEAELKKKLLEDTHRFADGGGEWVKGFQYIDNGMGDYFDFYYRVKLKENGAEIYVNKSDLPKRWQDSYEQIKEQIIEQVEDDLGITR